MKLIKRYHVLFLLISLLIGFIIRIYKISELMPFIGDTGWFYLSARDLLINTNIPLVGITSSHPWLHQGPLWTYLLSISLLLFSFNPVSGVLFPIFLSLSSILLIYLFLQQFFSTKSAVIACILFTFSPLVILHSRVPYHISVIPFFILAWYYFILLWTRGKKIFLYLSFLLIGILYNLELASSIIWFTFGAFFIYGIYSNKKWVRDFRDKKIIVKCLGVFLIPMIPILIYDTTHKFVQTFGFIAWIGYKIIFAPVHMITQNTSDTFFSTLVFLYDFNTRLVFLPNNSVALLITIASLGFFMFQVLKKEKEEYVLLALGSSIGIGIFILNKTPSEAYLPLIYPVILIIIALVVDFYSKKKYGVIVYGLIGVFCIFNTQSLIANNYLIGGKVGYGPSFVDRLNIARKIVTLAKSTPYEIKGTGIGSEFPSFTMNYEYLTWYLKNPPSKNPTLQFIIEEKDGTIVLHTHPL